MRHVRFFGAAALLLSLCLAAGLALGQPTEPGGVGYSPGAKYDAMSWGMFIQAVAPSGTAGLLTFETWATDAQTYTKSPVWPSPEGQRGAPRFQRSKLLSAHLPAGLQPADDTGLVPCLPPVPNTPAGNQQLAAFGSGNFPPDGCIAEEVRRNKPSFDFIVKNNLYSQAGLVAAYENWVRSGYTQSIKFPKEAIELKVDWVPVPNLIKWLANNGVTLTPAEVKQSYYVAEVSGASSDYALVGIHMSSKELPNWLWADLEHRLNPGRCDTMGCYDQFGVDPGSAAILPAAAPNTQYGACTKSKELLALFKSAQIGDVWNNYCLKGTQIDFVSPKGQPVLLGNSVVERLNAGVPISTSSCISCHGQASFDSSGVPFQSGEPIGKVTVPAGYMPYDFAWGVINLP